MLHGWRRVWYASNVLYNAAGEGAAGGRGSSMAQKWIEHSSKIILLYILPNDGSLKVSIQPLHVAVMMAIKVANLIRPHHVDTYIEIPEGRPPGFNAHTTK